MVNFRQVTITDKDNIDKIDLNDFDGYLMTAPTGFGIYMQSEYITIGNQRITTNKKPAFQKLTMTVQIMGNRSEWEVKYANLRDFISRHITEGFRLYYTPYDETRYIKCDINIVDKTEKDRSTLPIKLEIQPLSLWLKDKYAESIYSGDETGNLFVFKEREVGSTNIYCASFDLDENLGIYAITFPRGTSSSLRIDNNGVASMPIMIRIYGTAINPLIRLYKYGSNELAQYVSFNGLTVPEGSYLELNSEPTETYIELVNETTGTRADKESFADIDSNMYITIPQGSWLLTVVDDNENACETKVFLGEQYFGG